MTAAPAAAPPPPTPPSPATPTPSPPPAPTGAIHDTGPVRRESVSARRWSTQGPARVGGSVDVEEAELLGPTSIGGAVRAGSLRCAGSLEVDGGTRIERSAELRGATRFAGPFEAGQVELAGSLLASAPLRVAGLLRFRGDVRAPEIHARQLVGIGGLNVSGSVTAEVVDLEVHRDSRVPIVRSPVVRVRRHRSFVSTLPLIGTPPPSLTVLRIEASDVDLEGVSVEFLRAERIVLGPDCHVAEHEGTIVRKHPSARVGPESRSRPPYGLSR